MESSEKGRVCKRCLLREADPKAYQEHLAEFIEKLGAQRCTDQDYEARLLQCKSCSELVAGTCLRCGCYVELRAAAKTGHCPVKKW